nr:hypothetical protein TetV2_00260 [Oceanusvirus sp.]
MHPDAIDAAIAVLGTPEKDLLARVMSCTVKGKDSVLRRHAHCKDLTFNIDLNAAAFNVARITMLYRDTVLMDKEVPL